MVNYKCNRCGYETKHKANFITHLNRKNICAPILEDISIEQVKFTYGFEIKNNDSKMNPNDSKIFQNDSISFQNHSKLKSETIPKYSISFQNDSKIFQNIPKYSKKIISKKIPYNCPYCSKEYSNKGNLNKHLKICKIKKNSEEDLNIIHEQEKKQLIETVEKLIIECSEMKNIINNNKNLTSTTTHNTTNNNTTNNNTTNNQNKIINININNFGNENTKYLRKDYLNNLLEKAFTAIPKLIEKIHFNPKHPENHNIKITNKKEPYIKVRKNDKWELQDKKEILENLVDEKYYILEDHYAEVEENKEIPQKTKNVMDKFRDKFTEDKELQKDLQKKTEMIILNNS